VTGPSLPDGVYTVVPTPFTTDGSLDLASLERLVAFLASTGIEGVLVLGVMGEAPKLVPDERRAVVETSIRAAGGMPVVVGVTHPSVAGTRALAQSAEAAGAAAVLIAPPRLDRAAGDDVLVSYFADSADGLELEVVLQDHPASSGVPLPVELVARIVAEAPQVRTIKLEDPPTPPKVARIRDEVPELKVFGGLGGVFFLEELARGAHGTMTGFAFPELLLEVWRAYAAGDADAAAATFFRVLPLIRFEFQEAIGLAIRKELYVLRGLIEDAHVRAPAPPLDEGTSRELKALVDRLGLGLTAVESAR
jgi:4-hydroxy-tetrahydrodipicolinate synthase